MILSILAIGDELAAGERPDTNSAWIAVRAGEAGARTVEHRVVGDDLDRIADAIRRLAGGSGVVVVTGGLGPTRDDLTREALARVLGEPLVEDAEALAALHAWHRDRARPMPGSNRAQAMRPRSARTLPNPHGTAPGLSVEVDGVRVFCLPGPPREMRPMFEREVLPVLAIDPKDAVRTRAIPTFGLGESAVADLLGELMDRDRNPLVGTTASGCIVTCRIRATGDCADADRALDDTAARVRARLGTAVLLDEDKEDDGLALVRAVSDLLRERSQTVATVESCTGGLLAEMITRLSGSGDVFVGGLLTYANEAKAALAGVPDRLIERHGAVSREVALAMAKGGLERTGADHALSVTGIAGPTGGTDTKPVGTVWIACASADGFSDARRFLFKGGRDAIRLWSASTALGMLRLRLLGADGPLWAEAGADADGGQSVR